MDQAQLDTILRYIESGKEEGARMVTGGNRLGNKGYFVEPTIFADVQVQNSIHSKAVTLIV